MAGQQNAGKSTTFNMLTGANQHIANYPGVTVDKKTGFYTYKDVKVETVDLPGTYSLTSFSLEERVARDFLITEKPDLIVNVVDASSLQRGLYFSFQVLEMGFSVIVALNMMDVARRNSTQIDVSELEKRLKVPVVPTVGRKGIGKNALRNAILDAAYEEGQDNRDALQISYEEIEPAIKALHAKLEQGRLGDKYPCRWLAVKLIEGDSEARRIVIEWMGASCHELQMARQIKENFEKANDIYVADYMMGCRDRLAREVIAECVTEEKGGEDNITEMIDKVVLNRFAAPVFLVATVFVIYQLSIVKGYELTRYWWPLLAKLKALVAGVLPDAG